MLSRLLRKRRPPSNEPAMIERLEPRALFDSAPVVRISVLDPSAAEFPRDIGEFLIRRTGSIEAPLTVRYLITGRAVNGVDFTPLDTSVTIPAGRRTTTLPIIPIDDVSVEGNEEVVITLLDEPGYDLDSTGQNRSAAITIIDNDRVPRVTISTPDRFADEVGRVSARFVVQRSGQTDLPLTINLTIGGSAAPGADYIALPDSVTIRAGRTKASIYVRPFDDSHFEGDETVRITLQPSPDGLFTLSQTRPRRVSTWVIIRDRPMVSITVADPVATTDPSDTAAFLITRSGPTTQALRVAYSLGGTATPGDDYARPSALLTIPAGRATLMVKISGRGTQFTDARFKTIRLTLEPLAGYNLDLSNRESYSRYLRIWDVTQGPPFEIPTGEF
ncbi:MAG: Calx-beta domain-containing protein [Phycisphaerales bacterium]